MSERKDMPAFPVWELNGQGQPEMSWFGMSLRDYFAAKTLSVVYAAAIAEMDRTGYPEHWRDDVAMDAYDMADAMLAARERT